MYDGFLDFRFTIVPGKDREGLGPVYNINGKVVLRSSQGVQKGIGKINAEVLKFMPPSILGNATIVGSPLMLRVVAEAVDVDQDTICNELQLALDKNGHGFWASSLVVVHRLSLGKEYEQDQALKMDFMRQFLHNAAGETSVVAYKSEEGEGPLWAKIGFEQFGDFLFLATPAQPWINPKSDEEVRLRLVR